MGFKGQNRVFSFEFGEDTEEYAGLVIKIKSLPIKKFMDLSKTLGKGQDEQEMDYMVGLLADNITEWNIEDDDDNTLPISRESVETFDMSFIVFLIDIWMNQMGSVAAPLVKQSNSGETSQELQIPMETL